MEAASDEKSSRNMKLLFSDSFSRDDFNFRCRKLVSDVSTVDSNRSDSPAGTITQKLFRLETQKRII